MEKIFILLWIVFALYILVLFMVAADLWSGISKAKKNGVIRSSYGFRRTVEKIARYYNVLLALTIVDVMQMVSIWYMDEFYTISLPLFPFITLIGAIGISMIEVKSIYEKAEDKVKFDEVGGLVGRVISNKDDVQEIAKSVADYLKSNGHEKTTVKITTEKNNETVNSHADVANHA